MRVGLIGSPLGHSFSPQLHAAFGDPHYELLPLGREELASFFAKRDFRGINVTIPYKMEVIPFMDELHETALMCGAVNTVVNRGGKLVGYNTDAYGMSFALAQAGIELAGKKVAVLGSGGTSHTACAVARQECAAETVVVSRRGKTTYADTDRFSDAEVVINTTPVGMFPHADASPADLSVFPRLEGAYDAVFNPLRTRFIMQANALGAKTGSGLLMLTAQAWASHALFIGEDRFEPSPDSAAGEEIKRVWRSLMRDLGNIVLIGMPSSGKTTVGNILAKELSRPLLDTDAIIVARTGKDIPTIFRESGEAGFRALEREVVAECAAKTGAIISTGGGAVLSAENRAALAGNGFIALIERATEKLETDGRPLSRDFATLTRMRAEREPIYRAFADVTVQNDASPEDCAGKITEAYNEDPRHQRT